MSMAVCNRNEDVVLIDDMTTKLFRMYLAEPPATHTYTSADTRTELHDGEDVFRISAR